MRIEFLGAARTVTGSMHLVRGPDANVLLDCGLFQGRRRESFERNRRLPFDPREVDAVVLSHAHIDHSGALPMLFRRGWRGPVFATPATVDLCAAMLEDGATIQAQDARYVNRRVRRDHPEVEPVEPLYDHADVAVCLAHFRAIPYHRRTPVAEGMTLTFHDAGHVLGSAVVALDVDDVGATKRLCFTGDLGRRNVPILRDPEPVDGVEVLVTESTYGDRTHEPRDRLDAHLGEVVRATWETGGKVIIPTFALERAQELILAFGRLRDRGLLPPLPIYVDSPLTVRITDVFRRHPECYDADLRALLDAGRSPFDFENVRYVADVEESKAIDRSGHPCVILSASGMCESGRVLHHLRSAISDPDNTIVIVGFQAQHTLGRRLVERRARVRIFGLEHDRLARVVVLNGFSAHADRHDLLAYALALRARGPLRQVALVHGEPPAQDALREALEAEGFPRVHVPESGDSLTA